MLKSKEMIVHLFVRGVQSWKGKVVGYGRSEVWKWEVALSKHIIFKYELFKQ